MRPIIQKLLKRSLLMSGASLALLTLVIAIILWRSGPHTVADWISLELQSVANSYLNPNLTFSDLEYHYPLGVSLKNLRLSADDPAHPGHAIDILACDDAELALAEIPRIGKPIAIERIILKRPFIAAISSETRSHQFVGFSNLVKGSDDKTAAAPAADRKKLSDIFRMRKVELSDGTIIYDPRIAGTVPMSIDHINTSLNIQPAEASWYTLDTAISRAPVFDLKLAGQFNLDSFETRQLDVHLASDLSADKLQYLPPELQELLQRYHAGGKLELALTGAAPLLDPTRSTLRMTLKLEHGAFASGGMQLPIQHVQMQATLSDQVLRVPALQLSAFGGSADLSGSLALDDRLDADVHAKISNLLPDMIHLRDGGSFTATADARLMLSDAAQGTASFEMALQNGEVVHDQTHVPIDSLAVSAQLKNGQLLGHAKLAAAQNLIEMTSTSTLSARLDTDMSIALKDVNINSFFPNSVTAPPTTISGNIDFQSPLLLAFNRTLTASSEAVGTLTVNDFRMTTDDPSPNSSLPNGRLDFLSAEQFQAVLTALPAADAPMTIEHVTLRKPVIRAVAMTPGSDEFAGFTTIQKIGEGFNASTPAAMPTTAAARIGDAVRIRSASLLGGFIHYDPRIDNTVAMDVHSIDAASTLDTASNGKYRFQVKLADDGGKGGSPLSSQTQEPSQTEERAAPATDTEPGLHVDATGRFDANTLTIDLLKIAVAAHLTPDTAASIPPQLQAYSPTGSLSVDVDGALPVSHFLDANLNATIQGNNLTAIAGEYRVPIDQLRLAAQLHEHQLTFDDTDTPPLQMLGGTLSLAGTVLLNDRLDSNLKIQTRGVLLQQLMASTTQPPPKNIAGRLDATINFNNAPLARIAADASSTGDRSELPDTWGSGNVQVTHARLAGLDLVQGLTNVASTAFSDLFAAGSQSNPQAAAPTEQASVAMTFNRDHLTLTKMHYDGDLLAADGTGSITLDQHLDLNITGGPMSKLGGMGSVGDWIKQASNSLLYYHVTGTPNDLHYEVKRGDGSPVVKTVEHVADTAGHVVGQGIGQAGHFLGGLFKH